MPDWLQDAFVKDEGVTLLVLMIRLSSAFALGCVVAGIYRLTQRRPKNQLVNMLATLVLLTVLISMVTLVIGNSVARAFSLVGALAIVRFRTVVEDTRDTAFVIFAVAVGMAVGAGFLLTPLVGIPFAALAALLFRPRDPVSVAATTEYILIIRLGAGHAADSLLREPFAKHLDRPRLLALATARQGAALDVTYSVRLRGEDGALALIKDLNGLEGVQSVELKQA